MANRQGRQVAQPAAFAPRGLLPDGLLPVAYPSGEGAAQASAAHERVAHAFGRLADEAALAHGEQAGRVAGLEQDFRPTGLPTLRGRAFDAAATRVYQDNLDATMRTDMQRIFEGNRDNPTALKKGFDTMLQEYEQRHVFDQIRGSFRAQFARMRLPYENKALSNYDADLKDRGRAALVENIAVRQATVAQMAVADPMNPQTASLIDDELRTMDGLLDEAVGEGAISAEQAARLKLRNRDAVATRAAIAQAETLETAEQIEAYRENFRKAFAAGKVRGLSAEGFDQLDGQLQTMIRARRTGAGQAERLLGQSINDFVQRAVDGFAVSPEEWTALAASEGARSPQGQALLEAGQAKLTVANVLRNRSPEEGERLVAAMRRDLAARGETTAGQAELVRFAQKYVEDQRKALNTDQLGLAARKRIIPEVSPLDLAGFAASDDPAAAAALASQFRARTAQAREVALDLQRAPQFLRPDDRARLKEIVAQGGDKALALAGAIVSGADADAPTVLREISGDAPLLAQAGVILSSGGDIEAARDAFKAAEIRRATGRDLPGVQPTMARGAVNDEIGSAFLMQPEAAGRVRVAADAMTRTRLDRDGTDPASASARTTYRRALQEAAGAVFRDGVQYGGIANYRPPGWWFGYANKVVVPAGVRSDSFRDVIRSIRDGDLALLPVPPEATGERAVTARDLHRGQPVAVRGGYRFAMGDPASRDPKWIRGVDGQPFVLPFELLEPTLRTRVPGAFLGGAR